MIKRFLFFVVANLFLGLYAIAQPIEKNLPSHPAYDSLTNDVTYTNCNQYIGQKILMLPFSSLYPAEKRARNQENFHLSASIDCSIQNVYKPLIINNSKPSIYELYVTDYDYLSGKLFEIIDLIDNTNNLKYRGTNENGVFFKLRNTENNEIIYYVLFKEGKDFVSTGPWICMGYYEKFKQFYKNKTYIVQKNLTDLYEINTGKLVSCNVNEVVTCSDVTLLDLKTKNLAALCIIFQKSSSDEIAVSSQWGPLKAGEVFNFAEKGSFKRLDAVINDYKKAEQEQTQQIKQEIAIEQAQQNETNALIKKYGKNFGTKIARGEVEIGMTKNMCREAWGEPERKLETKVANGTTEKWFYPQARFLYFVGDKLNSLQY
ncbi:MAG TPA: hypothetical protein VNX01_12265 [Bacteroidia bacterium]|nr:hypothetical protein [Bacteroidia bacterium]